MRGEGTTHQGQSLDKSLCEIKACSLYHHMCCIAGIEMSKACYIQPMLCAYILDRSWIESRARSLCT